MTNNKNLALMLCIFILISIPGASAENTSTDIYVSNNGSDENTSTDIYVSNNGSDENTGLSVYRPKKTINNALKHVQNGGTIYIQNGNYKETLIVNKNVRLIGEGPNNTTIDGERKDHCIYYKSGS